MRVMRFEGSGAVYTSNVYLVLGSWNRLQDVNALVDVGRDPALLEWIQGLPTGVGKRPIEQVILTHSHYDHAELLAAVRRSFHPTVYAYSARVEGVDHPVRDGDRLLLGDRSFEVIHTPGHSDDSICLYCEEEGVLFAGDAPVLVNEGGGTYEEGFVEALWRLCSKPVRTIYFGHGSPLEERCQARLRASLRNVTGCAAPSARRPGSDEKGYLEQGSVKWTGSRTSPGTTHKQQGEH
jgi:glyoxylase-like metal-dependent hydrolase (beta-lactamase superfamily II)